MENKVTKTMEVRRPRLTIGYPQAGAPALHVPVDTHYVLVVDNGRVVS